VIRSFSGLRERPSLARIPSRGPAVAAGTSERLLPPLVHDSLGSIAPAHHAQTGDRFLFARRFDPNGRRPSGLMPSRTPDDMQAVRMTGLPIRRIGRTRRVDLNVSQCLLSFEREFEAVAIGMPRPVWSASCIPMDKKAIRRHACTTTAPSGTSTRAESPRALHLPYRAGQCRPDKDVRPETRAAVSPSTGRHENWAATRFPRQ
jgi:hypothetical protein